MINLKFGAFTFALCLLLTSCVCESTNGTNPCTIQDTIATCESNENFKSLQDATNITKLIVRSKELKRINKDDFTVFVNLEEIDLSNSGLEEIDENAFIGLAKLHKINLAGNTKLKIPNDASFITSNTLTCLNLSNTVVDVLDKTFAHLPQLQNLDLSGTNIKDFSPLEHLEHLTKLVVSKTDEAKDLCNILSIKEIIEKDANEIEIPLDCNTGKNVQIDPNVKAAEPKLEVAPTIVKKPETEVQEATTAAAANLPEATATTAVKTDESIKIEPIIVANKTGEIKISEATTAAVKIPEATTAAAKIAEATTAAAKIPEITTIAAAEVATIAVKIEKPEVEGNETKEIKNEKDDDPKKIDEGPEKETPTKKKGIVKKTEIKETETPEEKIVVTSSHTEYTVKTEVPEQSIIKNDVNTDRKTEGKENKKENMIAVPNIKDENPKVIVDNADDVILPSTSNTSQSNGVNIVLGIILCVMVVGAVGFGYKYWKNRRSGYTHANTHDNDDDDKELQTIVAHRTDPEQN